MWVASDEWQSEYNVKINKTGMAFPIMEMEIREHGYLKMEILKLGGILEILIIGFRCYGFSERLFKGKNKSYTSGIRKKLLNDP